MILFNYISILIPLVLLSSSEAISQTENWIYGTQKFYVVFAVILIIFFGIFTFLFILERKLAKIERQIKD